MLKEIIQTLDAHSRSAIALVFMRGGILPSPVMLTPEEENAISLLGGSPAEVRNALVALDGSLLLQVQHGGTCSWRLKHPTIRDAFAALIAENRELMDIYLAGTPVRQLFQEVSCGDVGLEGVKVIVPPDRYESLWQRIETFLVESREAKDSVNRFFASRCDREFLVGFIARNSRFVSELRVGSYLSAVSDVDVLVRLHQMALLPEEVRSKHVSAIQEFAVETPDSDFLRDRFRPLFTTEEFENILEEVRSQLLPHISECVDVWKSNHDGEQDPDGYFDLLRSALIEYRDAFRDDLESVTCLEAGLAEIQAAVEELRSEFPDEPDGELDDNFRESASRSSQDNSRSVFDDVDH